jgi:hypothetical protein
MIRAILLPFTLARDSFLIARWVWRGCPFPTMGPRTGGPGSLHAPREGQGGPISRSLGGWYG